MTTSDLINHSEQAERLVAHVEKRVAEILRKNLSEVGMALSYEEKRTASILAEKSVEVSFPYGTGVQFTAVVAETNWDDFIPAGPLVKRNEDTTFEEWSQRGSARSIAAKLTPQMAPMWMNHTVHAPDRCGRTHRPLVEPSGTGHHAHWALEITITEPKGAVMNEGFVIYSENPITLSNSFLPTVGERKTV